ncbi:MAG: hypothetical protein H8D23_32335 [Candidatus Brocadiales bacterium]|nr:hypothetical protein [Candidatus Brocadiales bacterium]
MYLLHYKLQSHRFSIQTGNKKLADLCSHLYPNSRSRRHGSAHIVYSLKMRYDNATGTVYEILVDGKNKYQTNIKSELFSSLEWMITCNALSHLQEFFQLHAGAVIKEGRIILLPANHGQGKTTLTLSLTRNNYRCLSDDIVLIEPETNRIIPFPRSFLIKDKSIKNMAKSHLIDKKSGYYCKSEDILYYNPCSTNKSPIRNTKPYTIIELKHSRRFKNELRTVSKSQMCIKLLRQSFNIHNYKRNGVTILTSLVRNSKCYSLKTNNVTDAVRLVSQI